MSVPKSDRSISKMDFYKNAIELRKDFTGLLLRDFGVKKRRWEISDFEGSYHISGEDAEVLQELCHKYEINGLVTEYPQWLIENERNNILRILNELICNITTANTIFPDNVTEYEDRRLFQDHAIANCEQLFQELQYCIDIFPVDANKYMSFVDKINREIKLLKGWRKGDNKILDRINGKTKKNKKKSTNENNPDKVDTSTESSLVVATDKVD